MEFEEHHRREATEPDLVPIVDCLVSVIFFLLFSTTFIELTKLTLPPAVISNAKTQNDRVPLSPQFLVQTEGEELKLRLIWTGDSPGVIEKSVARESTEKISSRLQSTVESMVQEFNQKFAAEKTIQLGLSSTANYQEMITVMDGIRILISDIVLISPNEVNKKETL